MKLPTLVWYATAAMALLFAAMQFVRPTFKDPPHEPLLEGAVVPTPVKRIFERACQDCHSNNTQWPWYAKVSPVSLLIADDVNKGRAFLNLSEWNRYSEGRKLGYLASMAEATRNRKMPPPVYSAMHVHARLTDQERDLIAAWARDERARVRSNVSF
jgi:Haem-binding domain